MGLDCDSRRLGAAYTKMNQHSEAVSQKNHSCHRCSHAKTTATRRQKSNNKVAGDKGFFSHLFTNFWDFVSNIKCSCGSSSFEPHKCPNRPKKATIYIPRHLNDFDAESEVPIIAIKPVSGNLKKSNVRKSVAKSPRGSGTKSQKLEGRISLNESINNTQIQNPTISLEIQRPVTSKVKSSCSVDILDDFLVATPRQSKSNNYNSGLDTNSVVTESGKKDGFFSTLLIRAEATAVGFFLGKHSLRTLARMAIGKAGVDMVDKTHELIHCLLDDPKKANKFINCLLKSVSEFGVLFSNGKIDFDDVMNLQNELERICQRFVDFNGGLTTVNDAALDTAKRILNESVCRIEEIAIEMLPNHSKESKSVKTIRQMAKICRQPMIIDKLYDKNSDAFRVAAEFGEKCEQINRLAEAILGDPHWINLSSNRNLT